MIHPMTRAVIESDRSLFPNSFRVRTTPTPIKRSSATPWTKQSTIIGPKSLDSLADRVTKSYGAVRSVSYGRNLLEWDRISEVIFYVTAEDGTTLLVECRRLWKNDRLLEKNP